MVAIGLPDAADSLQSILVTYVTAEGVAGVGGIRDDPALPHDVRGTPDEARLRIHRMDFEVLTPDRSGLSALPAAARWEPGPAGPNGPKLLRRVIGLSYAAIFRAIFSRLCQSSHAVSVRACARHRFL